MLWLYFVIIVAVVDGASLHRQASSSFDGDSISHEGELKYVQDQYKKQSDEFLLSLARAHQGHNNRMKRQAIPTNLVLLSDNTVISRLRTVMPFMGLCSPAIKIQLLDVNNITYAACISTEGNSSASVHLGYLSSTWNELEVWYVAEPRDLALFFDEGVLYILVADRSKNGMELVKYNISSSSLNVDHVVHCMGPTAVAVWKMKVDGHYHMAVANSASKNGEDLSSYIYMYIWMGTYFDKYTTVSAHDVRDIEPFHIYGSAYIVVANYRRKETDYFVDSEIFQYQLDASDWLPQQKIRTYGALDWQFFSLGEGTGRDFFLVVANYATLDHEKNMNSVIYKFVINVFVPFQCLPTFGATSVSAISDGSRFLLAIANEDNGLHLYQYDGWRFVRASVQYTQLSMSQGVESLFFHRLSKNNDIILAVSNKSPRYINEPSLFLIGFERENVLKPWYDENVEWCMDKYGEYQESNSDIRDIYLKNAFFVDQEEPIIINGDFLFDTDAETEKLTTMKLTVLDSVKQVFNNMYLSKLADLNIRIKDLRKEIDHTLQVLNKALRTFGDQNITAVHELRDAGFLCENKFCHFNNYATTMFNGEDISNLKNNIILIDNDIVVKGTLNIETFTTEKMNVDGLLDGIDFDTVMTKSGNSIATGYKEFVRTIMAKDVDVEGLVDNIKLSSDLVFVTNSYQNITGNLYFERIRSKWLEVTDLLNDVNLTKLYYDLILTDGSYYVSGDKTFANSTIKQMHINVGSTLNKIDLQDFWSHIFWKRDHQLVSASVNFASLRLQNLKLKEIINAIDILDPRISRVDQHTKVTVSQLFSDMTSVNKFDVNSINGIYESSITGKLDILTKNGHQILLGKKIFPAVVLDDHSLAASVDGVNISKFHDNSIHSNVPIAISRKWQFQNLVVEGNLIVGGSVSGARLADIYDHALKLNETQIHIDSLDFETPIFIGELESDNINDINIATDLVLINKPQTIYGIKTFRDVVLRDDSSVLGTVNQVNLSFLQTSLLRIGDQRITQRKLIRGDLKVKRLTVKGAVNDFAMNEVLLLKDSASITGIKIFSNVTFRQLSVQSLWANGFVNDMDVVPMMTDTMLYDGFQIVYGRKILKGTLKLRSSSHLLTENLNGINLAKMNSNSVHVEEDQTISGLAYFMVPIVFDHILINASVDGVSKRDIKYNWMLYNADEIISGNIYLTNFSTVDVIVNGPINGINVTLLNRELVKTTKIILIDGPIDFDGSIISKQDVTLSGRIQRINLSEEVALKKKVNTIIRKKFFNQDPIVTGNLLVAGYVDSFKISDVCENIVSLAKDHNLKSIVVIGDVMLNKGGKLLGTVSGINITSVYGSKISFVDAETFITGLKSFTNLTIEGSLSVIGNFGSINVTDLENNYLSLSRYQEIVVTHLFEEIYLNGALHAKHMFTNNRGLGRIDLTYLERRTMKTTGLQTLNAVYNFSEILFRDDVAVVGKVNSIEIPKALMQRNRTSYIQSRKRFVRPLKVLGNFEIQDGNKIQAVDISSWLSRSLRKTKGNYQLKGVKQFASFTLNDMKIVGLLAEVKISDDNLLLVFTDQILTGTKFLKSVEIAGNLIVDGFANNVDLTSLSERSVRKDSDSSITAMKSFLRPLVFQYLEAKEVDGLDVLALQKHAIIDVSAHRQERGLDRINNLLFDIRTVLNGQAVFLQYYNVLQSVDGLEASTWLYVDTPHRDFLLLSDLTQLSNGCTAIRIFEYNQDTLNFQLRNESLISSFSTCMKTFESWGSTFIVIAGRQTNANCFSTNASIEVTDDIGDIPSTIYYYEMPSNRFLPYQNFQTLPVVDVVTFTDGLLACIIFVEMYDTVVYCAKDVFHNFIWQEKLPTPGGKTASLTTSGDKIILALASADEFRASYQQSVVDIYVWNRNLQTFGSPVQVKESAHVRAVVLASYTYLNNIETYLFISEGTLPSLFSSPKLSIYKFDGNSFSKFQEIETSGQLAWTTLPSGELMLFVLEERTRTITTYLLKKASGFRIFNTMSSEGCTTMHVFKRLVAEDSWNHYVALAGSDQGWLHNNWQNTNQAKILKSKIFGTET